MEPTELKTSIGVVYIEASGRERSSVFRALRKSAARARDAGTRLSVGVDLVRQR